MLHDDSLENMTDESKSMSQNIMIQEDYVPSDEAKDNQKNKKSDEKKKNKKKKNKKKKTALELDVTAVYNKSNYLKEHTLMLNQNEKNKSPLDQSKIKIDKSSFKLDLSWMTNNSKVINNSMTYRSVNQNDENENENDQKKRIIRKSGKKIQKAENPPTLKIIPEERKKRSPKKKTSLSIGVMDYDAEKTPAIPTFGNSNTKREFKEEN